MKQSKTLIMFVALALALFAGSFALAQEKAAEGKDAENCAMGMTPEMMAKWAEMSAVTENHKALEGMVGRWTTESKYWAAPGGEPMASTGTCINSWVLDGRYVMTDYTGDMMGQTFKGIGYLGYDNYKQKYINIWMDSMSTMWMIAEGTYVDGVLTLNSEFDDFMTGQKSQMRQVVKVIDDDHHVMEMFGNAPDGTEFKMMVINYTRQ